MENNVILSNQSAIKPVDLKNQEETVLQNDRLSDIQNIAEKALVSQNEENKFENLDNHEMNVLKHNPIAPSIHPIPKEEEINIVEIDINAIQNEVNALNDPNKSTQEVLKKVKAKLEEKGINTLQLSSSLKKEKGSYIVEHYISPDSEGGPGKVCYKMNAIYAFKDGDRIIKIERPIYTTIPVVESKMTKSASIGDLNVKLVGILASKYKDLMVSEVSQDGRIAGYKTEAQKEAGAKQRAFVMKLNPKGNFIENIKPYGTPDLKKVTLTLSSKQDDSKYVKSLLASPEDAKIKGIKQSAHYQIKENELEYSTKEEAILKAPFKVRKTKDNLSFVDSLLQTNEMPEYLKGIKENIQKKQEEIKQVKKQFLDSSYLGLKKKESETLSQFIKDIKDQNSSRIRKIEKKYTDLVAGAATLELDIQTLQKGTDLEEIKTIIAKWVPDDKEKELESIEITEEKVNALIKFFTEKYDRINNTLNELNKRKALIEEQNESTKSHLDRFQRLNQELEFMNVQLHSIHQTAKKNLADESMNTTEKDPYKELISSLKKIGIEKVSKEVENNKKVINKYKERLNISEISLELGENEFIVGDFNAI